MPRVHPVDTARELHSLDRKGKRNIYLLLQTTEQSEDVWRFPQGGVEKGELLHQVSPFDLSRMFLHLNAVQAAQRDLHAECGPFMDTWIVSRNPIGVYKPISLEPQEAEVRHFETLHFMLF